MLPELEVPQKPTVVYQDDSGCIEWAYGGSVRNFNRQEHINILHHYEMADVVSQKVGSVKLPSEDMHSDFLTRSVTLQTCMSDLNRFQRCTLEDDLLS